MSNHPEAFRKILKASSLLTALPPKAIQELSPARTGQEAEKSVLFLVYPFTDDDFGMAMIEEAEPGVLASGVPEKSQARSNTGWDPASTHNKVIIIDERVVVRGLYNFSQSAKTRNDENTLLIPDPEIAVLYMEEFKRVWLEAQDQSQ